MMSYKIRLETFQAQLGEIAEVAFFPISSDLQYLTGAPRDIPNFGAVLHPGAWLEGAWMTPKHAPILTLPRMTADSSGLRQISTVEIRVLGDWDDPAEMVKDIFKGFELPAKPRIAISDFASGAAVSALHSIAPDGRFVSATKLLRQQRVIKSEEEIEIMRKAGEITEAAFSEVLKKLKRGITELEIVAEVDFQLRRQGALGPSFTTSLYNSGPNHPRLFGQRRESWKRVLMPPVSVLFDFGAIYEGYCYDFGRTVFMGEPTDEARRIHRLVMDAQAAGIAAMRAGQVTAEAVDWAARQVIEESGYGKAFRHRLGHAIGLDVHEPPFLTATDKTMLREGMLFTVEPSIAQFESVSARVEDVVVVRANGGEPLTRGFQNLIIIE